MKADDIIKMIDRAPKAEYVAVGGYVCDYSPEEICYCPFSMILMDRGWTAKDIQRNLVHLNWYESTLNIARALTVPQKLISEIVTLYDGDPTIIMTRHIKYEEALDRFKDAVNKAFDNLGRTGDAI